MAQNNNMVNIFIFDINTLYNNIGMNLNFNGCLRKNNTHTNYTYLCISPISVIIHVAFHLVQTRHIDRYNVISTPQSPVHNNVMMIVNYLISILIAQKTKVVRF